MLRTSRSVFCGAVVVAPLLASRPAAADDVRTPMPTPTATPSAPRSRAPDAEVTSDTAAQFYEMRSPTGATVITRRRLTTTLGAAVYDLLDKPGDLRAPTLTFRARLRYDADYGGNAEETAPGNPDKFIPGFSRGPVDLMYGYVEGRRFLNGVLGFRLGRQYVTDALGWWSFDGGLAKVTTPYYFAVEAYGGLEQRGGMPLSTSRFERDGVWRGDRTGVDPNAWPSFQPNSIAPAFGAAIESAGFTWLHGRLTYRRVYNTGESNVSEFASGIRTTASYDGSRISQERIGYAFDGALPTLGGVKGGFAYDLYAMKLSNLFASLDWYQAPNLTLSLDYEFYQPTFDGDSIWNFFMSMPMNDLSARAAWNPTQRISLAGGVRGRAFTVATGPNNDPSPPAPPQSPNNIPDANYYPSSPISGMLGGDLSGRYHIGEGAIGTRGAADFAGNGNRYGLDLYGERTLENRFVFQARTGVWHWRDNLRADRDATDFGYVLGAGYKLFPRSMVLADFQHDMNRLAGQRFRAMLWLTIALSN